jgi:hypothetical protein
MCVIIHTNRSNFELQLQSCLQFVGWKVKRFYQYIIIIKFNLICLIGRMSHLSYIKFALVEPARVRIRNFSWQVELSLNFEVWHEVVKFLNEPSVGSHDSPELGSFTVLMVVPITSNSNVDIQIINHIFISLLFILLYKVGRSPYKY